MHPTAGRGGDPGLRRHLLDALDPLFLLLGRRGRDPVHGVVPLHHAPVGLRLTGLNHLVFIVRDVELEAVLKKREDGLMTTATKKNTDFLPTGRALRPSRA